MEIKTRKEKLIFFILLFLVIISSLWFGYDIGKEKIKHEHIDYFWIGVEVGCAVNLNNANQTYSCLESVEDFGELIIRK